MKYTPEDWQDIRVGNYVVLRGQVTNRHIEGTVTAVRIRGVTETALVIDDSIGSFSNRFFDLLVWTNRDHRKGPFMGTRTPTTAEWNKWNETKAGDKIELLTPGADTPHIIGTVRKVEHPQDRDRSGDHHAVTRR